MRIILHVVFLCLLFLLFSCKKYKPSDPAFFIRANKASVTTNVLSQGSGSSKITDLWLYVNGQFEGPYAVGNLMPIVLKNNSASITVFAGIKNNGLTETRIPWQFYQRFDLDTTVEVGKTIIRDFTFNYNSATVFPMIEGFDDNGFKLVNSPISEVRFTTVTSPDSFEGRSMLLELAAINDSIAQVESAASYSLPAATANVYLEINYKCNSAFSLGIIGDDLSNRTVITLNPISTWNKTYISLADVVNENPISTTYKVFFRMLRTSASPADVRLYLDNVKLVYIPS